MFRKRWPSFVCAGSALSLFLAGCPTSHDLGRVDAAVDSGTDSGQDAGPSDSGVWNPAFHAEIMRLVAAYCAAARSCCQTDGFDTSALGTCEADVRAQLDLDFFEGQIASGEVTYDPNALDSCLDEFETIDTSCAAFDLGACFDKAFGGTKAAGSSCMGGLECASAHGSSVCLIEDPSTTGVCRADSHGVLDAPCFDTCVTSPCGSTYSTDDASTATTTYCFESDGLVCSGQSGTCVAIASVGDDCQDDGDCGSSGYCDADSKCQLRVGPNGACSNGNECPSGSWCDVDTCVPARFAFADLCDGDYN